MIELNINIEDKVYDTTIPSSWEDITVDEYMRMQNVSEDINKIEQMMEIISIFTKLDMDLIGDLPADDFNIITEKMDFLSTEMVSNKKESLIIDGYEYFVKNDFNKLTMTEMINIDLIIEKSGDNFNKVIDKLLCIFLRRKVDGKLESFKSSFMERAEIFRKLKIVDVHNLFIFFSTSVKG